MGRVGRVAVGKRGEIGPLAWNLAGISRSYASRYDLVRGSDCGRGSGHSSHDGHLETLKMTTLRSLRWGAVAAPLLGCCFALRAAAADVPEGTPEELAAYIDGVQKQRPNVTSNDELKKFIRETRPGIVTAADKIRGDKKANEEQRRGAALAKIEALVLLTLIDTSGASGDLLKFSEELAKDGEDTLAQTARMQRLEALVLGLEMLDETGRQRRYGEIKAVLAAAPADRQHAGVAMQTIRVLESLEQTELAATAYRDFAEIFKASDDEAVAEAAERFARSAQRMSLLGNPFVAFTGADVAGNPFDSAAFKGKVLLIDFWATWCGPCVAELPNVKQAYEKYHDRGFEVVGISLDDDLGTLKRFLEENEIPWVTLLHTDSQAGNDKVSVANFYGVSAIPTVILIGRDGKVVSLMARGEELVRLLEEQFPEDAKPADGGK